VRRRGDPFLIENVVDYGMIFGEKDESAAIRERHGLNGKKVLLYAGTFEPYQGIDLIIDSSRRVIQKEPRARFMLVGGHPDQVAEQENKVRGQGLHPYFVFTGQVQPQEVAAISESVKCCCHRVCRALIRRLKSTVI